MLSELIESFDMRRFWMLSMGIVASVLAVLLMQCVSHAQEVITPDEDEKPTAQPKPEPKTERTEKTDPTGGIRLDDHEYAGAEGEAKLLERLQDVLDANVDVTGDVETRRKAVVDKLNLALSLSDEYLKRFPKGTEVPEVSFRRAWIYYQLYRYDRKREYRTRAMEAAAELLGREPKSNAACKAHGLRMQLFRARSQFGEAILEARNILAKFPEDELAPQAQYFLYDLYRRNKEPEKAADALRTLVKNYPKSDWADKARGVLGRLDLVGKIIDLNFTKADGTAFKLSDHRGKVVLVIYWSSANPSSIQVQERLKALHDVYRPQGLLIIGVNLDRGRPTFEKARAGLSVPWTQCFDGKAFHSPAATVVGVTRIPSNVLVDSQGRVHSLDRWGRQLRAAVVSLLEKR